MHWVLHFIFLTMRASFVAQLIAIVIYIIMMLPSPLTIHASIRYSYGTSRASLVARWFLAYPRTGCTNVNESRCISPPLPPSSVCAPLTTARSFRGVLSLPMLGSNSSCGRCREKSSKVVPLLRVTFGPYAGADASLQVSPSDEDATIPHQFPPPSNRRQAVPE